MSLIVKSISVTALKLKIVIQEVCDLLSCYLVLHFSSYQVLLFFLRVVLLSHESGSALPHSQWPSLTNDILAVSLASCSIKFFLALALPSSEVPQHALPSRHFMIQN